MSVLAYIRVLLSGAAAMQNAGLGLKTTRHMRVRSV